MGRKKVIIKKEPVMQYFSKFRKEWVDFKNHPTPIGEIISMKKYFYKIREKE